MSKKGRTRSAKTESAPEASPWADWIRFELYGILIVLLSVISLAKLGAIGKIIDGFGHFLLGEWHSLLGLYGIYVGIAMMFKRHWPFAWTVRQAGAALFIVGLLMITHTFMYERMYPVGGYRGMEVITQTWQTIWNGMLLEGEKSLNVTQADGGGMIGAIIYALMYALVDPLGAELVAFTCFAVGLIMLTGMSYVTILSAIKNWFDQVATALRNRGEEVKAIMEESKANKKLGAEAANTTVKKDKNGSKSSVAMDDEMESNLSSGPTSGRTSREFSEPKIIDFQSIRPEGPIEQITMPILVPVQGKKSEPVDALEPLDPQEAAELNASLDGALKPIKAPEKPYEMPSVNLLKIPPPASTGDAEEIRTMARKLETTLESFGVRAKVLEVHRGPAVTRFELQPDVGVKVSRIVSLNDDIALALAAKDIRIEAPIPGKAAIGIEVPNSEVAIVGMREMMETKTFIDGASPLTIAFGRDISGQPIVANLVKMPHMLVAGATGSGKSVCINGIITSILYKAKPDQVRFLMIDPKMVELNMYNGIPHLLAPVVTDPRRASLALKKVVSEMEKRYELFSKNGARNIDGYNAQLTAANPDAPLMPYIVVIVDELADLMMVAAGDVEDAICRLAQMARAAGIHLIIATQRPSVDVITGVIKANIPSRIAFGVSSQIDSRTILDGAGAEKLLGRGDMLFLPMGASKPVRVQGAFISDVEVEAVVNFVKDQGRPAVAAEAAIEFVPELPEEGEAQDDDLDELFDQAVQIVVEAKQASVSLLQRRMRVGYARAARLVDQMEAKGIVGPYEGSKPREVLGTARWKGGN